MNSGSQPINVNNIRPRREVRPTVSPDCLPLVAIRMNMLIPIMKIRDMTTPACEEVDPMPEAMASSQSLHITILDTYRMMGERYIKCLLLTRGGQSLVS